jgi:hypothetical protein
MTTTVRLYWNEINDPANEHVMWNEILARTFEQFGLPGDRYMTNIDTDWMDWHFVSEKDATMFILEHGGDVIPESQITVEFVGSLMR